MSFGRDIAYGVGRQLLIYAVIIFAAGAGITAALIYGVPWLWHFLKPWLHTITA
jgi:hypothetical protein